MYSDNEKSRKQVGEQNQSAKRGHTNMSTKTTNCRENSDTKIATKKAKKTSELTK